MSDPNPIDPAGPRTIVNDVLRMVELSVKVDDQLLLPKNHPAKADMWELRNLLIDLRNDLVGGA